MTQGDSEIVGLEALEILDSRGWPTLEVSVRLKGGAFGKAAVPSGKSTGRHEAVELRDLDKARYQGRGVRQAVRLIETEVQNRVLGHRAYEQAELDGLLCQLDGTSQKSRLGANSILAVSLATCQAAASLDKVPLFRYLGGKKACRLPVPFMNILNGGVHADNHLDIQEFMIVPLGLPTFSEALRAGVEIFHKLEDILKKRGHSTALGDEGGFAPQLQGTEEAFAYLVEAIEKAHYKVGEQVALAVDVAASELYDSSSNKYRLEGQMLSYREVVAYYEKLSCAWPLVSIEDGLDQEDYEAWQHLNATLGDKLQLVGDDLFVTKKAFLEQGIKNAYANAILIKPNQVGTLTESAATINLAKQASWKQMASHRSGETEDVALADLAVGWNCGQIKAGSLSRSERLAKYNRLLWIERYLGKEAVFQTCQNV